MTDAELHTRTMVAIEIALDVLCFGRKDGDGEYPEEYDRVVESMKAGDSQMAAAFAAGYLARDRAEWPATDRGPKLLDLLNDFRKQRGGDPLPYWRESATTGKS